MYTAFFGLNDKPFSITPDPRYIYMSARHREALAHLNFGVTEGNGFVLLSGEVGTGKTTLCRALVGDLPEHVELALILNPRVTPWELLGSICDELRIEYPHDTSSLKALTDVLNAHLLRTHAEGRRTIVLVDEAQNLSEEVLEQVRLLTNLETATEKLLQIILVGQPELNRLLARPALRQLNQRITARYHLDPLTAGETAAYVRHRLAVCGRQTPLFSAGALRRVHKLAGGVPRLINIICDRALLGAYAQEKPMVNARIVARAAAEVTGVAPYARRWAWLAGTAAVAGAAGWGAVALLPGSPISLERFTAATGQLTAAPVEPQTSANIATVPAVPAAMETSAATGPAAGLETPNANADAGPPAVEPPAPVALDAMLRDPALISDGAAAMAALVGLWQEDYQRASGDTPCQKAASLGLSCLEEKGTWNNIRRLNRPAIIRLLGPGGRAHEALLERLGDDEVGLRFGAREIKLPLAEVDRFWLGEYLVLWRPPPLRHGVLKLGLRSEDVTWLRAQLGSALDEDLSSPDSTLFDATLAEQVRRFQQAQQLNPDGIVGSQTLLRLSSLVREAGSPAVLASQP